ncbi:MAG: ABC transporter ATP-binding protein [Chitinophagaceae bacterium]|nr:ABC transporter ATP-binding protein [Chitinophagaceae bacterium]
MKKYYNKREVLNIPFLLIEDGQVVGLTGNNGQGKSTLLKLILDLTKPASGQVLINQADVRKTENWKSFTGSYLNESYLIDYLRVEEYFSFIGFLNNINKEEQDKRIARFEDFFRGDILNQSKYIRDFSTGNKCKIGIAAAFLSNPKIVFLDEPFAHLDPYSVGFVKAFFKEYTTSNQATLLISSHQLNIVCAISTRVIVLKAGNVVGDIINENVDIDVLSNIINA